MGRGQKVSSRPQEPMIASLGSFISPRLPPMPTKLRRASSRSSPSQTCSSTSRSRMGVSGCVRKASCASRETSRSKSKSLSGRPILRPLPTYSAGMPLALPGSQSRIGTSWPTTTARFSRICNAFWQSVWGQPPALLTAATFRCCLIPS